MTNIIALIYIWIQFTLKVKLQEQTTVTTTEKKRQLMDNFPFYCLVFNSEGYHDTAQSLQSNQINLKACVYVADSRHFNLEV